MRKHFMSAIAALSVGTLLCVCAAAQPAAPSARREFRRVEGQALVAGDDILMQRLVHLVDDAKRNELMIIYIEDLGRTGLVAADLAEGGRAASRWPEFSKALLERAVSGMKISR